MEWSIHTIHTEILPSSGERLGGIIIVEMDLNRVCLGMLL